MMKTAADLAADGDDVDFETEHDARRREMNAQDPVHTVNLIEYFQTQLSALSRQVGEAKSADIVANIDVETLQNMREYVQI